ncbi:MAG: acyl-CoA synthetase [Ilumatobacteraceae bacterium]
MAATNWNFADIWEAVAKVVPSRAAHLHGDTVVTWHELDRRADALAASLLDAGLGHQSKVACYLHNGPEYLETVFGALKAAMVPVNTNYRYGSDEIVYLFENADVEAVVFHAVFTPIVDAVRGRLPKVREWFVVADAGGDGPSWATKYSEAVARSRRRASMGWSRSGDDLVLLYTGGTTGMPKGVMWRQDDLFNGLGAGANTALGIPPAETIDDLAERALSAPRSAMLVACPLMHGAGQFAAMNAMARGGTVATLASSTLDAAELLDAVERHRLTQLIIVGQAFARPILEALDAHPGRWDLSSLVQIVSSGVMWNVENKEGLLRHMPHVLLFDSLGSSEALGVGRSVSDSGATQTTATFVLGPNAAVFAEDGRRVEPGSGGVGMLAVGGFTPLGYYKDPDKSAATFRTYEGRRWSVPGDWATIDADGTINLLGRGSVCINTGGEKVFPEEVEEVLKTHPSVRDAVAVGIPNERFGEAICAVVESSRGARPTLTDLSEHVRGRLAGYKAPRHLVVVESLERAPNGKVDYKQLRRRAAEQLGVPLT